MRARTFLDALAALPFGTLDDLVGNEPFLVLSPHPDDETLGCGGLILKAVSAGVPAHVLILTDGAASHPNSRRYAPPRLAALRREEARRAMAHVRLPPGHLRFLDLPDAATPSHGPNFDAAVEAIVRLANETGARSLFVTWGRDPHCDHETASAMARAAARRLDVRLWAYPVWGLHLKPDVEIDEPRPRGYRLDIALDVAAKRRALDCYASQMTRLVADDPAGFSFTEAQLAPFLRAHETFIAATP